MAPSVRIALAMDEQRDVVARLMQFYIYDFTELLAPEKVPHLNATGGFDAYPRLDAYWSDPDDAAWMIHAGEQLAGFALLNNHSHVGRPVDFNMAEFFVARPFRRRGVARSLPSAAAAPFRLVGGCDWSLQQACTRFLAARDHSRQRIRA